MDLEGITLSELSQTEKDKYHMISFIWGILKTKPPPKQAHRCREQIGGFQRGGVGVNKMGKRGQKIQTSGYKTS